MRIGLLASVPRTVDAFFIPWIDRWRADGQVVSVAAGPDRTGGQSPHVDTEIRGLSQSPRWGSLSARRGLKAWCRSQDLDVILTNTATASAMVRSMDVGCPVVYFCHGLHWVESDMSVSGRVARAVERSVLARTAAVVTMNRHDRAWLSRVAPEIPSLHLNAGIGLDLDDWPIRTAARYEGDRPLRLVWVGDFSRRKRPHDAVEVLAWLRDQGQPASLVMVGDGPLLEEVRASVHARGDVACVGRIPALSPLQEADVLVHTASWEGLSRVLLESSAIGLPSFGYVVKGVVDCPGTSTAGAPGDSDELAGAVLRWVKAGALPLNIDREVLNWRRAHTQVTDLLQAVARSAC